jgi:hypothetical protein
MSHGSELKSPGAMALQNAEEVNRIRASAYPSGRDEWLKQQEIDRAWQAMKAGKANI